MNYYSMETQMFDRQREILHNAEMRRLALAGRERPLANGKSAPRSALVTAIARTWRSMLAPGRTSRIEHPEFGDAS
ncbi:MAG TPA: hypothetical protein VKT20_09505 [Candidatus Dormibacteraeota bacterium]|nr:hypothetical protein [Candidatus Dormibacteraeota bacterium]